MTVIHTTETTPVQPAPEKPAKARKAKKSKKPDSATVASPEKPATEGPAKRAKSKRPVPLITMKVLGERYIQHLAESGKSPGTALSYMLEITTATKFLGEDTPIATLTPDDVRRFNDSKQVMLLRSGKPKAQPSYLKTQRVLRLALVWSAEQGWIEKAPLPTAESK